MRGNRSRNRNHSWLVFTVAVLLLMMLASPALAMSVAKITVDEKTGGQPTRFTFTATTDADATVSSIEFVFPEGFDVEDVQVDVTLLEGLRRIDVEYSAVLKTPDTVIVSFVPPMPANSNLLIQIRDVMTPRQGDAYEMGITYSAETTVPVAGIEKRTVEGVTFKYVTPDRAEELSRWLDQQAWVDTWNSATFLGIFLKPQQLVVAFPLLLRGWFMSLALVACAFPLSILGGLAVAFMKMSKIAPIRWISAAYINVIRGTPLFLQIFVVFIGLRASGVRAPDFLSAVTVLTINSSAYLAEIFRAGIQSISKGQFEAASSLGMTYWQAMQHVIIPQTVRRVLPTMTSEFILLFKDTALFAAVGIFELMLRAQNHAARSGNLTAFVVAACYYLVITIPLINLVGRLEARLAQSEHGVTTTPGRKKRGELLGMPGGTADQFTPGASAAVGGGPQTDFDNSPAKHESR